MSCATSLLCDGCGQAASPEHVARRLQRLEWSTRFRPVHIGTLLLGAVAPASDAEYLYTPADEWEGEAAQILDAAAVSTSGKTAEAILSEFQRAGFFLIHVLECPVETEAPASNAKLLEKHLPAAMTRIRRSLRPKRLVPISGPLAECVPLLLGGNLGAPVLLHNGRPLALDQDGTQAAQLREMLGNPGAARYAGT